VFPTDHPLWSGMLGINAAACRKALAPYRLAFYIGGPVGFVYPYSPGPAIPDTTEVVHLSAAADLVGRTYPTRIGLIGDVRASIEALTSLIAPRIDPAVSATAMDGARREGDATRGKIDATARGRYDAVPIHPMAAVHALLQGTPPDAVVVDEAITTGGYLRGFHRTHEPDSYYFCRGGGLGWGMPAALGIKLARPDRPVLCVVGDGSAMYSIQSLYTAARHGIAVVFAVVNNRQYRILRDNLAGTGGRAAQTGTYVGLDLDRPPVDYVSLAAGLGVQAMLVERAADVVDATRAAFASGRPWLLELPIQRA
jgi:benzoylformate decarboxylase